MPEVSRSALVLSIQAIAREVTELQQTINDGDAVPEDFQMMDDLLDVARELRQTYENTAQSVLNLPPYDELVG